MHDTYDFSLKWKCKQSGNKRCIIIFCLACSDHVHQYFPGSYTTTEKQMPQISGMLHFLIMHSTKLCKKVQHTGKNSCHIRMHQFTVRSSQHIIGASLLMQANRKGTVLIFISKGKFHLIAVSKFYRASMNSLPMKISILTYSRLKKPFHLIFLHLQLFLIGHGLIHTATTGWKNRAYRLTYFQRGFLQNLQESAFRSAGTLLVNHKAYLLARNTIFHNHLFSIYIYISLIWKINLLNDSFVNLAFFHNSSTLNNNS